GAFGLSPDTRQGVEGRMNSGSASPENGGSAIVPRGVFRALRRAAIEAMGTSIGAWRSPVSALVWETRGRRFKSSRSDHFYRYFNCMPPVRHSVMVHTRDPAAIKGTVRTTNSKPLPRRRHSQPGLESDWLSAGPVFSGGAEL